MTLTRSFKYIAQGLFSFLFHNLFLLFLIGFFAYRTFFLGRLNWALLVLLIALFLIIVCRAIAQYRRNLPTTLVYRTLVLLSIGLLLTAIFIQLNRLIFVFLPGLSEPTLPKILVRIGISTATLYVFALLVAFVYYMYAHDMTKLIWNGSINRLLDTTFSYKNRQHVDVVRSSNRLLIFILIWGGLASTVTLLIGLVAWLLR